MRQPWSRDRASEDNASGFGPIETRRSLLRRSGLLAGVGLTALLVACGDDEDTEPGVPDDSGLEEGAEDPDEAPGIATETGIESGPEGNAETEEEGPEQDGG